MSIDTAKLQDLIDEYWMLAFQEGKEGREHDTEAGDAQRVRNEINSELDYLRTIADADKASADHWRAECEKMRKGGEAVARQCHVFNVTKSGPLTEWEPTTMAFALPDGKHELYTSPPVQADACKVPPGYVLVPVEPTPEMLRAATKNYKYPERWLTERTNVWHRMLSAAPTQVHDSDCALHNAPAYPPGPCDCSLAAPTQVETQGDKT